MLDIKQLRKDIHTIAKKLKPRGFDLDIAAITELDNQRKVVQTKVEELQNRRNLRSKAIGQAKAKGENIQPLLDEVSHLGDQLKATEDKLNVIKDQLNNILYAIPNIPHNDVPSGDSEE